MRHHREDVVDRAITVLDTYGLADLTMRRLGAELGVQPSALYHHVANKQTLLAAVADEILARGRRASRPAPWDERVRAVCTELRDAMLAYRDGADVVATAHAFGLGAAAPYDELVDALTDGGFADDLVRTAARTLLHFVFGHTSDEQTHLQAGSVGAIDDQPRDDSDFELGLALVLDGIRLRLPSPDASRRP
ncbi:TetR/AcrR family transcriptional regulator C-terminal domain-containing protein [Nocardioides sp. KIGAM211]|uniref:TetR/AcrR family transcriptional regulator C-terminal domain-containing protein n=1 Tax=Nocardioides luti TaxID=2761101 RepID=A0A7X0REA4_9ACTN|nr:TetR/AcrR family transcriptional regulator C-terminal domain-containing protein [Nocardioides luti]MBB6626620.1 TetR/AcrR family transcriptional regulator C-terminal domain-containing protein [Nocardioides luti]